MPNAYTDEPETDEKIRAARSLRGRPTLNRLFEFSGIAGALEAHARARPDAPFLSYYDEDSGETAAFTYAAFRDRVLRAAGALASLGVRPGDRIASMLSNHPDTVALYFAAWILGVLVSPVNPGEDDARTAFVVDNSEAKVLFARPEYLERCRSLRPKMPRIETIAQVGAGPVPEGIASFLALWDVAAPHPGPFCTDPDAEALLVYTSGTTGPPKGVVLTQYNLLADAWAISRWQGVTQETVMMCVLPLHHVNGITVTLVTPLFAGAQVVLARRFFARSFWARVAAGRVNIVSVVPTLLQFLLDGDENLARHDLSAFRHFVCGAGTLSVQLAQRFEDRFEKTVLHGYGMSEGTCYQCFLPTTLSAPEHRGWLRDHGYPSIGCEIEANEMAIHGPDGTPLDDGEKGEIVYRGHNVMRGYFKRPDANREAFKHGWFRSGDEGFGITDPTGRRFYFISGRLKELINRGGVKYSPFEIEEVLLGIPGVATALVVGFDNDYYGEEVGCYLVLKDGATLTPEQALAYGRARMPFPKSPKVAVIGKDVPVTSTGKYQRLSLKGLFREHEKTQFRERG